MKGAPFSRVKAFFDALAAYSGPSSSIAQATMPQPVYESRGKAGKKPHRSVGTKAYQRAALKRRNKMKARHG